MIDFRQATAAPRRLIPPRLRLLVALAEAAFFWGMVCEPSLSAADFLPDQSRRHDILVAVVRGEWPRAVALAQDVPAADAAAGLENRAADMQLALERLAQWTLAAAVDQQPGLVAGDIAMPLAWRHPLVQPTNKEAFNLLTEIQTALKAGEYEEASQLLTSISDEARSGLLPDVEDHQLFVSLPTAISTVMHAHPEWRLEMIRRHGDSGQIQVRRAMADRDLANVDAATLRFQGTPAAAEAHQWLGDRQLAIGNIIDAETQFRAGLDSASAAQIRQLLPRLQLAAALTGRRVKSDEPPVEDWPLNHGVLEAKEVSTLLKEIRSRQAAAGVTEPETEEKSVLPPGAYRLTTKIPIAAALGKTTARDEKNAGDRLGKQLSAAADEARIYVSNRQQIAAYDRATGDQKWAIHAETDLQNSEEFGGQPLQPVVTGDCIFVRRFTRAGVELCCINRADGTLSWQQRPRPHVLTDPLITLDEVRALVGGRRDDDLLHVELARWNRATGRLISLTPLAAFRDVWNQVVPCQWAANERWIACQIGPVSAVLTHAGELRWLRRPVWLPPPVDDLLGDDRASPPRIDGEQLHLAIPGSRAVECVEISTGKLLWRTPEPDLCGFRGLANRRLVLDVGPGFHVLDAESGETVWRKSLDGLLDACLIDDQTILCAQREPSAALQRRPVLVWLSLAAGNELHRSPLETGHRDAWQLGPLWEALGKHYVFGGEDARRELFEVSPGERQ